MGVTAIKEKMFEQPASEKEIEQAAAALEANGFHTIIAENREQARKIFFELVPEGSQVHQGASVTLEELGITEVIEKSGRYDAVRPKIHTLDRQTQADEIRRLRAGPSIMAGSVHALTLDGHALIASLTGSQLAPYAAGAGKVIWVVGAQKIVTNIAEGFRRIEEYVYPLEEVHMQKLYGTHTGINKILIVNKERPGRITIILIKEAIGF